MSSAAGRRFIDRLGVRLGLVIGLALLPVGVIAVVQASDLLDEARARSEAALAGETLRAVRPKLSLMKRAQGAAEAMAALGPSEAGCGALRRLVDGSDFAFAGFYATDGTLLCRAGAAPADFIGTRGLADMLTGTGPGLSVLRQSGSMPSGSMGAGDAAALVALHPERDAGGRVTGFVAISPREGGEIDIEDRSAQANDFSLVVFDRSGTVLSFRDAGPVMADLLPQGQRLETLAGQDMAAFTALAQGGETRVYSLVLLADDALYALGTWPAERSGLVAMKALPPLIFPALMWSVSLIAAWFAAELLVARHIRRLRSAIRDFAGGDRAVQPLGMTGAPKEIRDAAEAFERMTYAILRDEAELEDMLREKEVLLREVHHRVKNNLQLIASMVNMQIRRTRSDEARMIMRSLQERMVSLATVHNGLYQTADLSDIGVGTLFPGIIEQVTRNAQAQGQVVAVESNLEPVRLTLDQAVPLALLLTEALSGALKYASTADGSPPRVVVTFRLESREKAGEALLEVSNSASGGTATNPAANAAASNVVEPDGGGTGIGTQLLRGFAKQLNGQFNREFAGGMCHVRVWFSLATRAEAA